MTTQPNDKSRDSKTETLEQRLDAFFHRLPSISGLLKALTELPIQLVVESRDSKSRWLLDLATNPMVIHRSSGSMSGTCSLAASAADLDGLLLGNLTFVQGFGERRLLIGGSMHHLLRFYCLLTLTPVLFAEHLFIVRTRPNLIQRIVGRAFGWIISMLGSWVGSILRHAPREDRLYAVGALARGVSRFVPGIKTLIQQDAPPFEQNHPLEPPKAPLKRRIGMRIFAMILSLSGAKIGLFRYKLGLAFDLFQVLSHVSATIQKPPESSERL